MSNIELIDTKLLENHVAPDNVVQQVQPVIQPVEQPVSYLSYLPNLSCLSYSSDSLYFTLFMLLISIMLYYSSRI